MERRIEFDSVTTRVLQDGRRERIRRPKLRLEVIEGVDAGAALVCEADVVQVGAQPGNALRLTDPAVSRFHLELTVTPAGIAARDLGSTNGTTVRGIRVDAGIIPSGSVVEIGSTRLRVEALDEQVDHPLSDSAGFGEMIGCSPSMRAIFALLERVSPTDETVLITGETGTGKDLCARSIVAASARARRPFEVFDCGAVPPSLLESELFGHTRGAFTGAVADYRGAFERANGGTLFFDEIGELPLELQTRLLRAVDSRVIRRVGSHKSIALDVRLIAATNRCLEEEVNRGTFRADLYYRLSVVRVRLPALRKRPEDIPLLVEAILRELNLDLELSDKQLAELARHRWPGNVRELRNALRRAVHDGVSTGDFDDESPTPAREEAMDTDVSFKEAKQRAVALFERRYLTALLRRSGGNISEAARLARTDRAYLTRLVQRHNISKR